MHKDYINKLKRRLNRCKGRAESLNLLHTGNEANYTFHGGWSLGYLQGQIKELEDFIDDLEESNSQKERLTNIMDKYSTFQIIPKEEVRNDET